MEINDGGTRERLERILRQVGGSPKPDFKPRRYAFPIGVDLHTPQELEELFDKSGLLIIDGHPVFAYIRDHTVGNPAQFARPEGRKKVHFTVCRTLTEMRRKGRFTERYRATNRCDDLYEIDIMERGKPQVKAAALYPCQNCLDQAAYQCFSYESMGRDERRRIVENFKAREALSLAGAYFEAFREIVQELRSSSIPSGYPAGFNEWAKQKRKECNHTCQECGVRAPGLVEIHHIDSDKQNNRDDNFLCLCRECHAQKHAHYQVSPGDGFRLDRLRRQQGIVGHN